MPELSARNWWPLRLNGRRAAAPRSRVGRARNGGQGIRHQQAERMADMAPKGWHTGKPDMGAQMRCQEQRISCCLAQAPSHVAVALPRLRRRYRPQIDSPQTCGKSQQRHIQSTYVTVVLPLGGGMPPLALPKIHGATPGGCQRLRFNDHRATMISRIGYRRRSETIPSSSKSAHGGGISTYTRTTCLKTRVRTPKNRSVERANSSNSGLRGMSRTVVTV